MQLLRSQQNIHIKKLHLSEKLHITVLYEEMKIC